MKKFLLAAFASSLGCGAGFSAWAARPFVTDDARLTNAGSCQVETWVRSYPDSRELWALPACNPWGNLELTLGRGWARNTGEPPTHDDVVQLKTLLRPLQTDGWGLGVAVGMVRHPEIHPGPNQLGNHYVYLPLSLSFDQDRLVMHANLGWLRDKATARSHTTWGLGVEAAVWSRVSLIAESFGDERQRPYAQAGARFALIPNLLQIDATLGRQLGGSRSGQWLSVGLRFTP